MSTIKARSKKRVIVCGGGAAGMMAAWAAASGGCRVILLERNEKPGKKLFITGKGRCNLTNSCDMKEMQSHVISNPRFLYSAFHRFSNRDMIEFLAAQGIMTKTERGGRVFPVSDHSSDVIKALRTACVKAGVQIRCDFRAVRILTKDDPSETPGKRFVGVLLEDGRSIMGDALILATGGYSYQSTGSTGDGYRMAQELGHTIIKPEPSLVPFRIREPWCRDLMGLSLKNVGIRIVDGKKRLHEDFGEMLFTHFGVSGPVILTASTRLGKKKVKEALTDGRLMLYIDMKPALDSEQLKNRFLREFDTWRNKNISSVIEQMLPKKMVPIFLDLAAVPHEKKVHDISRQERARMIETMKAVPLHIEGVRGFEEAIITRGGVSVREIDPGTMESKVVKNLYFAGEIIDVDAETGGYNLQIAWSTGYTAGVSV